ncbi:CFEM domain-containing protein [Emericellopsis cladophorae]|uniref:CFEM domain-containing protein n=1 Tax=Emericellopsis cladophorae TaxID=2686198 RepID=A0A9P9XUH4_9HYPO|nr:CFEM domain-containing protein [Emericellopsis cladophorae]KAI6777750.1 CFEM domain-containing protein [Emericellopsis cladophorae]
MHQGSCVDANAVAWASAATNIALDLWLLAVPLWQLRTLRLHRKKKIGVGLMFCVGIFVTVLYCHQCVATKRRRRVKQSWIRQYN